MSPIVRLAVLALAPLLTAALWMDDQPSYKAYEPPVMASPAGSVPFSGKEAVGRVAQPAPPTGESLAQGKELFAVYCALCHGQNPAQPGPVGAKLKPPPPGLDREQMKQRSDVHIFNALTRGFGRMPPFRDKLTPQERWSLVNYLRTRR